MTIWQPSLDSHLPLYLALADALARDLSAGLLQPGVRLPPQRELADFLGVTVGTVSRGYAEAERRGLVRGEVGRGTFIRGSQSRDPWPSSDEDAGLIDFSLSLPVVLPEEGAALAATLRHLSAEPGVDALLHYRPETAAPHQRQAAAEFLNRLGFRLGGEDILVTAGSQQGLNAVLASIFSAEQLLISGELTYPSIKAQAASHGLRLKGVALDKEGMRPDAVAALCEQEPRVAGLYLVPTIQNPTTGTMSPARRRELAELAEAHDLWIIEDDVHSFLPTRHQPPIAVDYPDRTIYLCSLAKCLAPGLRTGFITAPKRVVPALRSAIHAGVWMAAPLMVEIATRWLVDGTADRLIEAKRRETRARQQIVADILGPWPYRADPEGYIVWLELPEPWYSDQFVTRARERGVIVVGAGAFAVGRRNLPQAVRISIGQTTRADLEKGLKTLAQILGEQTPTPM